MIDRWLEKDVTLKLLALAVAVVLWLRVASVQSPVVSVTLSGVPVQTVALAADLAIAEVRPDRVEVTMRAPRSTLNRLGPDDLRAEVDLKGAGAGRLSLPVSVKAPRGVQVLETRPAHVQVSVDYLSERQVPVQVVAIGVVGEDYRVESPLPSPTEVLASGPRGQVARVRWAAGEVDVTGATADVLSTVALRPVDNTGKEVPGITLRPQEVQVKFTLVKLPPAKEVTVQATLRGEPPLGFRLEEARVSPPVVRIRGPEDRLNAITSVGTKPIDLQDLRADGEKEVGLALPPGVVMADPPTVLVYLRVAEDIGETEVSNLKVEVRDVPPELTVQYEPESVKVTLRGRKDLLPGIQPQVWVQANVSEGDHLLPVQVLVPSGIEVVKVEPAEVTVRLRKPNGSR